MKRSCPAVSQICSVTSVSSIWTSFVRKSAPMVACVARAGAGAAGAARGREEARVGRRPSLGGGGGAGGDAGGEAEGRLRRRRRRRDDGFLSLLLLSPETRLVLLRELALHELVHERRLAHAAVPQDDDFEELAAHHGCARPPPAGGRATAAGPAGGGERMKGGWLEGRAAGVGSAVCAAKEGAACVCGAALRRARPQERRRPRPRQGLLQQLFFGLSHPQHGRLVSLYTIGLDSRCLGRRRLVTRLSPFHRSSSPFSSSHGFSLARSQRPSVIARA